jgi:C4-dicarboxylate-specific signal transduction histidine kinase
MVVVSGLSVYIAREMARQRVAQAQALLALQRHQTEVAHVLRVSALGEMAAQLAHELTQPLGAIANYAAGCRRRLEARPDVGPEIVEVVERISHEALRAGGIIRRMREFLQKSEPQREPVDVNELVREVAQLLDGEARERGVHVDLQLHEQLPRVEADGVEIEQVLVNLARNALEAMQDADRPRLAIETRFGHADTVEVFVRDSGPGLPQGGAEAIFEPFYTTKPRGLGMGLAISRTIVELHGGTLAASSSPSGAIFRFTLPIRAAV